MRLFAHVIDGEVVVTRVLKKKFRKPAKWIEIKDEDLPPREDRDRWAIQGDAVVVDESKVLPEERRKAIRRQKILKIADIHEQQQMIFDCLAKMQMDGIDISTEVSSFIGKRNAIK